MGADKIDMSKYTRVPTEEKEEQKKGHILVGKSSILRDLIAEVIELLSKDKSEGGCRTVVVKARGPAVSKAVTMSEVLKRRVAGLHQVIKIDGDDVVQKYVLKEGEVGEKEVTRSKFVTGLQVCLSLDEQDKTAPGYQAPLPEDRVQAARDLKMLASEAQRRPGHGGRGGGRGAGRGGGRGGARGRGGKGGKGRGGGRGREDAR